MATGCTKGVAGQARQVPSGKNMHKFASRQKAQTAAKRKGSDSTRRLCRHTDCARRGWCPKVVSSVAWPVAPIRIASYNCNSNCNSNPHSMLRRGRSSCVTATATGTGTGAGTGWVVDWLWLGSASLSAATWTSTWISTLALALSHAAQLRNEREI